MSQSEARFGRNQLDQRWTVAIRYGPYLLLAIASTIAFFTAELVPLGDRYELIVPLVLVVAVLHRVCVDRRWPEPPDGALGAGYLVLRTAIAFVLTWLNPFFALFAVAGYFDADEYVPRRWAWPVLLVTAVTMAGSQSGGLPPSDPIQTGVFVGLFVINAGLVIVFAQITWRDLDAARDRDATIVELEQANARLEEAVAENERLQAELLEQARQAGVHEERERLALEIHDTIAQSLTGIVTQLQAAADASEESSARRHRYRAAELARGALGEARRSVQGLLPATLEHGGLDLAMRRVVDDFSRDGAHAELVTTGEPAALGEHVEATVVRVAQEALANVARHARAGRVAVTLSYLAEEVLLDVRDDGAGFDLSTTGPNGAGGFGLPGMAARAGRVAGELVVESEPGAGTAVSLRVPVAGGAA